MVKHFLSIDRLGVDDIEYIFGVSERLKKNVKVMMRISQPLEVFRGKTLAMIFAKPSTRTRVSFETAMTQLGGHAIYLNWNDLQLGRGETIADTARVLSRYVDCIMARLFEHGDLLELAEHSSVPVINGLTDLHHPCQALSDLYTIKEKFGSLQGLKMAFVGDGNNNVTHSLMQACTKLGVDMVVACPGKYRPSPDILVQTKVKIVRDPFEAVTGADVIYTDTWVSMGMEKEAKSRIKEFRPYQVNSELLKHAKKSCVVMHDLPAHRGQEITDDVMDGPQSIIWDQAENRLHVQKGILMWLMGF